MKNKYTVFYTQIKKERERQNMTALLQFGASLSLHMDKWSAPLLLKQIGSALQECATCSGTPAQLCWYLGYFWTEIIAQHKYMHVNGINNLKCSGKKYFEYIFSHIFKFKNSEHIFQTENTSKLVQYIEKRQHAIYISE